MATIEDLHEYISDKWRGYCAADPIRPAPYNIRVPFTDWEARFFMRGLELGLFDVTGSDGIIIYGRLGGETKKNFFYPRKPGNCREAVTQFAAITELIEAYGYPAENVLAESVKRGKSQRYALDALVFECPRPRIGYADALWPPVSIAMEAKSNAGQVKKLMRQIDECQQRGSHDNSVHTLAARCDHAKFQGILDWQPAYFWVVSPIYKDRASYLVRRDNETSFSLEPVNDIPKFTASTL
jgi:hypothetical protein